MITAYLQNATRMWASLVPDTTVVDGLLRAERPQSVRRPTVLRMPVMVRQPAPLSAAPAPDVRVTEVRDPGELAGAEQTMVDGFPMRAYQPYVRAQALPPPALRIPRVSNGHDRDLALP